MIKLVRISPAPVDALATPLTRISYPNLWPDISLTYEAQTDSIAKSTYTLAPGADPTHIRLRYNVPGSVQPDGSLSFAFETGRLTEAAPIAWQNISGRRVRRLTDGPRSAGAHAVRWDGRDDSGCPVGAGIYFLRLRAESGGAIRRVVVMR